MKPRLKRICATCFVLQHFRMYRLVLTANSLGYIIRFTNHYWKCIMKWELNISDLTLLCEFPISVISVVLFTVWYDYRVLHSLLWPLYAADADIIFWFRFFFLLSFFFPSPNLSGRRLDVYHVPYFYAVWSSCDLECRSEMCCSRLAENTGRKKVAKNRNLGTIAQLCRAISSSRIDYLKKTKQQYLLYWKCSTQKIAKNSPSGNHPTNLSGYIFATKALIDSRKKNVKQQCLPHMSSQYGELRPTSGWDLLARLGHPS